MRGLLVDFGGVLTTNVFDAFGAFCVRRGLERDHVKQLFRSDPTARELLVGLEEGTLDEAGFEQGFGARLGLEPDNLIADIFADVRSDPAMVELVVQTRAEGYVTGLLSNSWGSATEYDLVGDIFDARVISSEEGMRKPDPRIYALAAERMGLDPAEIVYVDDLGFNLKPPREQGFVTILHEETPRTIAAVRTALEG